MNKLVAVISTLTLAVLMTKSVLAQVTPDIDMSVKTDLIAVKTDPVLKNPLDMIGIKTDPVLSNPKDLIAVKTDPVLQPQIINFAPEGVAGFTLNFSTPETLSGFSLNIQPVAELLAILAKQGAKVETKIIENNGLSVLKIIVNGKLITPVAVECDHCGAAY